MSTPSNVFSTLRQEGLSAICTFVQKETQAYYEQAWVARYLQLGDAQLTQIFAEIVLDLSQRIECRQLDEYADLRTAFAGIAESKLFDADIMRLFWKEGKEKVAMRRCKRAFADIAQELATSLGQKMSWWEKKELFAKTLAAFRLMLKDINKRRKLRDVPLRTTFATLLRGRYQDVGYIRWLAADLPTHSPRWQEVIQYLEPVKGKMLRKHSLIAERQRSDPSLIDSIFHEAVGALKLNAQQQHFRQQSSLLTYFTSIFNNKCVDFVRAETRNKKETVVFDENRLAQTADLDFERREALQAAKDLLRNKINSLGQDCRRLLILVGRYPGQAAVAEQIGKSVATVSRSTEKCLDELRTALPTLKSDKSLQIDMLRLLYQDTL